jgi:AraC family transcriptional regulator
LLSNIKDLALPVTDTRYASFTDYYEAVHAHALIDKRNPGGAGRMFKAAQAAGDWSDPATPELGFSFITEGVGSYTADLGAGRFHSRVRRGETILVAPGAGSSIQRGCPHAIICYALPYADLMAVVGADAKLPPDGDFGVLHRAPLADTLIPTLLKRLWGEAVHASPGLAVLEEGVIMTIAALLSQAEGGGQLSPPENKLAPWQTKRVIGLLADNLDRDVTLKELASEARLSPYHFARAFKSTTGLPPGRYHLMLRMERTKVLLETTDFPIGEVAAAVGYSDPSYLARIFRRETGTAPCDYRRARRS